MRQFTYMHPGKGKLMDKKKICFIAQFPPPVHGLSAAVDMLYNSALADEFQFEKVNITNNRKFIGNILYIIKSHADLYYFTISQTKFGNLRDLMILKVLDLQKKKCLVHLHGGYYRYLVDHELPVWQKKANYRAVSKLRGAIVLGDSFKNIFRGMLPENRIIVAPNCVDDDYVMSDDAFDSKMSSIGNINVNHVLYLSNFIKTKGYRQALKMAKLEKQRCDSGGERKLHFDFAGRFFETEEKEYFERYIQDNELQDYVTYHGIVTGQDKKDLFNKCTIFILLTRYYKEGQPISIIEAMGNGMMIVTTDHAGIPDIVQNGVNGIVCAQNYKVKDIYDALLQLEPQQLRDICLRNRAHVQKNFSESVHIANMKSIFINLCNK